MTTILGNDAISRVGGNQHPRPPFTVNKSSPQYNGLKFWWPLIEPVPIQGTHVESPEGIHPELIRGVEGAVQREDSGSISYDPTIFGFIAPKFSPNTLSNNNAEGVYINCADSLGISGPDDRTICLWVKKTEAWHDNEGIWHAGPRGISKADFSLETQSTAGGYSFQGWDMDFDFTVSPTDTWHHISIVSDGQIRAYVDGQQANSLGAIPGTTDVGLKLASLRLSSDGSLADDQRYGDFHCFDLRVYDRALTQSEHMNIWDLYEPVVA